jgi:hypothetical protein
MIIDLYDIILRDMKEYNAKLGTNNYGNTVVAYAPTNPNYPITVFDEIRNVATKEYSTPYQRNASCGYKIDVFAKTKSKISKQTIARKIAQQINTYLTDYVGLQQVSFNVIPQVNDDSIYQITMMYEGTLNENRAKFI